MSIIELKNLIASKLGIPVSIIHVENFKSFAVRFTYLNGTYRVTTDLNVEKVDGSDSDARHLEKLLRGEQWDGTGLPPVGTICQMRDDKNKWIDVEIIANHKGFAHGWQDSTEDSYYSNNPSEFRPLCTERDKAIEQISDICGVFAITQISERIYDVIVAGKIDGLGKVG